MTANGPIAALRVANEGFLVASTIERCPKTMMLRELVMNALEAANTGSATQPRVCIRPKVVDGITKLSIWNTGLGMTASELHSICDLASSLNKVNALDRNFGMGAKVASLPSNKYGLRYRSCRNGVVSEVMMGQRQGIYGRIPYRAGGTAVEAEVDDVTERCRNEGSYDLSADWTEVVLLGNRPEQDMMLAPYDNDPSMPAGWIIQTLGGRFFRLPSSVSLTFADGEAAAEREFIPMEKRFQRMDRLESVSTVGGIVIHYVYDPVAVPDTDGIRLAGQACLVHRNEVYATRAKQDWLSDAPLFGMPFGARHFCVIVELPDDFEVRPDLYRQFLRFTKGDQRQVYLGDFAPLVRDATPDWLREIIASYGPSQVDFLGELGGELQDLLIELGIVAQRRGIGKVRGMAEEAESPQLPVSLPEDESSQEDTSSDPTLPPPSPPAQAAFEKPPEIIALSDDEQIDERGLQGRAAKYYPATHQLFVNLTYSAVVRLTAQLEDAFQAAPGGETKANIARDLAEWAMTRMVSRAVVYSLGKKTAGWLPEEVARVQSPESLSIVADDYTSVLPIVQQRMALLLGLENTSPLPLVSRRLSRGQRLIGELADARQAARRALQTPSANPAPILRRVSSIEAQRRNWPEAVEWAQRAIDANPTDADSFLHLARVLHQKGDADLAEEAALKALDLSPAAPGRFLRQLSTLNQQRGQHERALEFARRAVAADPADRGAHHHLIELLLQQNELDGAEEAIKVGLALHKEDRSRFLRHLSALAMRRGDRALALELARQALDANPSDQGSHQYLGALLLQQGDVDAAEPVFRAGLEVGPDRAGLFLRQLSVIEARRKHLPAAILLARQSLDANPFDVNAHHHLIGLLLQQGDFEAAESAIGAALEQHGDRPARLIRHQSTMAARRGDPARALELARQSLESDPSDASSHHHLISLLLQQNEFAAAEAAIEAGLAQCGDRPAPFLRFQSMLAARQNDSSRALELARHALDVDSSQPYSHHHLIGLLLQQNDLDAAEVAIRAGLARHGEQPGVFLRQLSVVAARRKNMPEATQMARQSVEANPSDINSHNHLIGLLLQQNELDAAEEAIEAGLIHHGDRPALFLRHMSTVAARRRDPATATDLARRALEADPSDATSHFNLIGLLLQQNDLDAAEAAIEAGLALHENRQAWFIRHQSILASKRGDPPRALERAREAVATDPSDVNAHYHLIGLLLQQNQLDVAEAAIEAALAQAGHRRAPFLRHQSNLAARRRDPARALELARTAVDEDTSNPTLHQHLIGLLLQQNELDAAEQAIRRALDQFPERSGLLLRQLSIIEARRKNWPEAVRFARQSLEAEPSDPWSHDHLIGMLLQSGDLDGAERAAHAALQLGMQNGPDFTQRVAGIGKQRKREAA